MFVKVLFGSFFVRFCFLASEGPAEDAFLEIEDGYLEFLEAVRYKVDEKQEEGVREDDVAETIDRRE